MKYAEKFKELKNKAQESIKNSLNYLTTESIVITPYSENPIPYSIDPDADPYWIDVLMEVTCTTKEFILLEIFKNGDILCYDESGLYGNKVWMITILSQPDLIYLADHLATLIKPVKRKFKVWGITSTYSYLEVEAYTAKEARAYARNHKEDFITTDQGDFRIEDCDDITDKIIIEA